MGQQPNVELTEETAPRPVPSPGPANAWRADKPGVPQGPGDVPSGGRFGHPGPDPGYASKLVARTELPDPDPRLKAVVTGLVMARAAALGRAAIPEDIEAALVICGFGDDARPELIVRRRRWLEATAHEQRPGATAVAEIDRDFLINSPGRIRFAYRLREA